MSEQEKQENHEKLMEMTMLYEECFVDINQDIAQPPLALSFGEKEYHTKEGVKRYPIPLATYGNFSFVQAPPKSMKTYFMSLLSSGYANNFCEYTGDIKSYRGDRKLIHFDTEQGLWHSQRVFKRVLDMNEGLDIDFYKTFALRSLSASQRVSFIDYILDRMSWEGETKVGLVIIDGLADLVNDVNNIEQCNELIEKVMTWTVRYDCHIITAVHSNFGSEKPTGHLGSAMEKKAETQIQLEFDQITKSVSVKCKRSRNTPFEEFSFNLKGGLPCVTNTHSVYHF